MLDSCFSFPGRKCWAIGLSFLDSSVGQLIYLPRTQDLGSSLSFPGLKCWAVDLAFEDSSVA